MMRKFAAQFDLTVYGSICADRAVFTFADMRACRLRSLVSSLARSVATDNPALISAGNTSRNSSFFSAFAGPFPGPYLHRVTPARGCNKVNA